MGKEQAVDHTALVILFRWLHIVPAAVAIGGVLFMRVILPAGLSGVEEGTAKQVMLRCRRVFKMVIHTCILLLLISGTYNTIRLWPGYNLRPGLLHGLWGMHVILGLVVFGIAVWLTVGEGLRAGHRKWLMVNLVLIVIVAMMASVVKTVRETSQAKPAVVTGRNAE